MAMVTVGSSCLTRPHLAALSPGIALAASRIPISAPGSPEVSTAPNPAAPDLLSTRAMCEPRLPVCQPASYLPTMRTMRLAAARRLSHDGGIWRPDSIQYAGRMVSAWTLDRIRSAIEKLSSARLDWSVFSDQVAGYLRAATPPALSRD